MLLLLLLPKMLILQHQQQSKSLLLLLHHTLSAKCQLSWRLMGVYLFPVSRHWQSAPCVTPNMACNYLDRIATTATCCAGTATCNNDNTLCEIKPSIRWLFIIDLVRADKNMESPHYWLLGKITVTAGFLTQMDNKRKVYPCYNIILKLGNHHVYDRRACTENNLTCLVKAPLAINS